MERYTHVRTLPAMWRDHKKDSERKEILRQEVAMGLADVGLKLADAADAMGKSEFTCQMSVRHEACPELPGTKITITAIWEGK